jgi:hypothetical protein
LPSGNGRVGGNAGQVDDAPGSAVHHLKGAERDPGRDLDVPEAGQVLDPGKLEQPGQALPPAIRGQAFAADE